MTLDDQALLDITQSTCGHYNSNAEDFWIGTKDHDVSQNINALLSRLGDVSPLRILDFGCGPGRDLLTFSALGHEAVGLDGAVRFCDMARSLSGCSVLHQDFLALDLPPASFDGIFANASLFHIPSQELGRVMGELLAALKPGGVLFSSNPRGQNVEGWNGDRYGAYYDLDHWRASLESVGFMYLSHYFRPAGLPVEQQPWLASLWQRPF